jgi:alkanesulfonate monooxygenase SsuD/methylene tetrahydromethanopterin reductase-like flavin-dependent oxidoreductase (luciferase family)
MLAVAAICAETEAAADAIASSQALSFLLIRRGRPAPLPSPEEAAAYPYTAADLAQIQARRTHQFIGTPDSIRDRLDELVEHTGADELMVTTIVHDPQARKRSYELLASALAG